MRLYLSLIVLLNLLIACTPDQPNPPIQAAPEVQQIIKSGQHEERVEYEAMPQNNCKGKTPFTFNVERQRTLEESVQVGVNASGEGKGEGLVSPAGVGVTAELALAVGAEYGVGRNWSTMDGGGMEFNIEPSTYVVYVIAWREKWERGQVVVKRNGQDERYDYLYQKTARPEVHDVQYTPCEQVTVGVLPTSTATPEAAATWTPTFTPEPAPTWTPTHAPQIMADSPTATPIPATPTPPPPASGGTEGGDMILIPAGEFTMGSDTGSDDEKPVHQVYLADYYIDKYETTNAQYAECVSAGKCTVPKCDEYKKGEKANHPVVCVDWTQVKSYCEFAGKRLPTEAEWEKAARGTDGRTYPWGNEFDGKKLNYCDKNCTQSWADKAVDDGYADTAPVGSYPSGASPFGVMDMAGNVWEWTSSDYKGYPYIANDGREELLSNNYKVLRGGGWDTYGSGARVTYRLRNVATSWDSTFGGRCVR